MAAGDPSTIRHCPRSVRRRSQCRICPMLQHGGRATAGILLVATLLLLSTAPSQQQIYPGALYNPASKDWNSVLSACLEAGAKEKRYFNFFTRSAFHDSMSTLATLSCKTCIASDGSLFTTDELTRAENVNDGFANTTGRIVKRIANKYGVSVADTLAVCGMAATRGLNNGFDAFKIVRLKVGKYDSATPNQAGQLPGVEIGYQTFSDFFTQRGLTLEDGIALTVGAHALVDEQGCYRGMKNNPRDYCNPFKPNTTSGSCSDVRMFSFDNHAFVDACTPSLAMPADTDLPQDAIVPEQGMPELDVNEFEALKPHEMCKFTSGEGRWAAYQAMLLERQGTRKPDNPLLARDAPVFWANRPRECKAASVHPLFQANCPHPPVWMYTELDARLGMACQNPKPATPTEAAIKTSMLSFATNKPAWQVAYAKAYAKMVTTGANWVSRPMLITGRECASGWVSASSRLVDSLTCQLLCPNIAFNCPVGCICRTGFWHGSARPLANILLSLLAKPPSPPPPVVEAPAPAVPDPAEDTYAEVVDEVDADPVGATPDTSASTGLSDPPTSPFGPTCVTANGQAVLVDGYPASPLVLTPFQDDYQLPPAKKPDTTACRDDGLHCMEAYNINVFDKQLSPFDLVAPYCAANGYKTWFMTYDGTAPGPTIRVTAGTETLVRFNNNIQGADKGMHFETGQAPCDRDDRTGRPISIHLHGSASLAPYDGWADDVTCRGEAKEYIYPNNRPVTAWYHDHGFFVTNVNAYSGMAAFYIISEDKKDGSNCSAQPFNLNGMEELPMMFADKVLDNRCQLLFDQQGRHHDNLYGDINTVNGIPWPKMSIQPKWYRLRVLNAGPTRPYLLKIKDSNGQDLAHEMCYVVAGDGGWREKAAQFPRTGVFLGVAERYDVICDFSKYPEQTLYLWNDRDDKILKKVPMFCYSHLLAKIAVGKAGASVPAPVEFKPDLGLKFRVLSKVFSDADWDTAVAMAKAGKYDRKFAFGRRQGHWVINGETWESNKIAANDVGQNTWELWLLKTGGGWYHPIHVHLVDFLVVQRNGPNGVLNYEAGTPKDVVFLGPSQKIWVVARFGPHRGDYMFHCHNLVHEDNDMLRAISVLDAAAGRMHKNLGSQFMNISAKGGVLYSNFGYDNPEYGNTSASKQMEPLTTAYVKTQVDKNLYKIFYPGAADTVVGNTTLNPWLQACSEVTDPAESTAGQATTELAASTAGQVTTEAMTGRKLRLR